VWLMLRSFFISIILLIFGFNLYIHAGYSTAEELFEACNNSDNTNMESIMNKAHCYGFIDGISEAHAVLSTLNPSNRLYCMPPEGVETGEVIDIVVKYLNRLKENEGMTGRIAVLVSLKKEFPCK